MVDFHFRKSRRNNLIDLLLKCRIAAITLQIRAMTKIDCH